MNENIHITEVINLLTEMYEFKWEQRNCMVFSELSSWAWQLKIKCNNCVDFLHVQITRVISAPNAK